MASESKKSQGRVRKKGRVLMTLGVLCLVAAAIIAAFYLHEDFQAGSASGEVLDRFEDADVKKGEGDDGVFMVDGQDYIGVLVVPSQNLQLPVLADYTYDSLRIAPCRYSGGYFTNDLVIAGHSYRSHFAPLYNLGPGDEVDLITAAKRKLSYEVIAVETLQPTAVEDMVDNDYDLSLFTCTPDSMARWTVRCNRAYGTSQTQPGVQ